MNTKTIFAFLLVFLFAAVAVNAQVYINEALVDPLVGDSEFIELYNDGTSVSLEGWELRDESGVLEAFDSDDTIDERLLITVSGLNNAFDTITLVDSDNETVDEIPYGYIDEIESPEDGDVIARIHDGNALWIVSDNPTPGEANNRESSISGIPGVLGQEGETIEFAFTITDQDNDSITITPLLPSGISSGLTSIEGDSVHVVDNEDDTFTVSLLPSFNFIAHPETEEEFNLTLNVQDGFGTDENITVEITVDDVNQEPVVENFTELFFTELMENTHSISATDADDDNLTYSLNNEPAGMSVDEEGVITWAPISGAPSANDVEFQVNDGFTTTTQEFNAEVVRALTFSNVEVNSVDVEFGEDSVALTPGSEYTTQFTVTNNLDRAVTGITSRIAPFANFEDGTTNINAGSSRTITRTEILPLDATSGSVASSITVIGEELDDRTAVITQFRFNSIVNRESADVFISEIDVKHDELTCIARNRLDITLANRGDNDEDDIILTVTGEDFERVISDIELDEGEETTQRVVIPASAISSGSNSFDVQITFRDEFGSDSDSASFSKNSCLTGASPSESSLVLAEDQEQRFNISLAEDVEVDIQWSVTLEGVEVDSAEGADKFAFKESEAGVYTVTVTVNEAESESWSVTVTDAPLSDDSEVTIEEDGTTIIENSYGKIEFLEDVDFGMLVDLDSVIQITSGQVAVDTEEAPQLDREARITLKRTFDEFEVQVSEDFGVGPYENCITCDVLSNSEGEFIFDVTGFSTYRVIEVSPADLILSDIDFGEITRESTIIIDVPVRNAGTSDSLTGITSSIDIADKYLATLSGVPASLDAGEVVTANLEITIPEDEDGGRHKIGTVTITSAEDSETVDVFVDAESALVITSIEINGKSSGDLELGEENEIEIEIENTLEIDIEDVEVEILMDLGDDEIDENEDIGDIRDGDEEKVTFTFSLDDEDIEEESFTLEITVTGEDEDGASHTTIETKTVDLDLEKHKLTIESVRLSPNTLTASSRGSIQVNVKNIGSSDEDEVEVRVFNSELGIDANRDEIDIDEFTSSRNDERVSFNFVVPSDANAGAYQIEVEVFIDGDLEDSTTETLTIQGNSITQTTTQQQNQLSDNTALAQQLQRQLEAQMAAQDSSGSVVTASFRETNTYTAMLAVLIALVFIAMILLMSVMLRRR